MVTPPDEMVVPSVRTTSGSKSESEEASSGLISPILSGRAGRCGPSARIGAPVLSRSGREAGE